MNQDDELLKELSNFRRTIHKRPELALTEFETSNYIVDTLQKAGFDEIHRGLAVTGVVAVLKGTSDSYILIRADIDGLPIQENNDLDFKSEIPKRMHACVI